MIEDFDSKSKTWDQHRYRIERAQIVADAIKMRIPLDQIKRALDFGCGTGLLGLNLVGMVKDIVFTDTSSGMLHEVDQKIKEKGIENASTLLLSNGKIESSFDLIVSLMVLHHIDNIDEQIKWLSDALEPDGYICLCDLDQENGSFHQEERVPHNGFRRESIIGLMERNGVKVVESTTVYVNKKMIGTREHEFPVFMIVGRKSA